jgi:hypothetical protein
VFTRFDFLGDPAGPLQALRGDGWDLEGEADRAVRGTHPEVPDEAAARCRLDRLGLLTSRSVRIRSDHSRRPAGS